MGALVASGCHQHTSVAAVEALIFLPPKLLARDAVLFTLLTRPNPGSAWIELSA